MVSFSPMGLSGVELTERLDSLWFFSNPLVPFSSRSQTTQTEEELPTKVNLMTPTIVQPMGEPLTPKSPIAIPCNMGSPKPKDADFKGYADTYHWPVCGILGPTSTRRQGKRSILGEVKFLDLEDGYYERIRSGSHDNQVKLPSLDLDDAVTMKEQLKSWAYAVACTVK